MKYKEFLKPTKEKIILFILAILLILGVRSYLLTNSSYMPMPRIMDIEFFFIAISWIFGLLIFSYLLSCLIIFIINKLKKKHNK